jgi:hypothetical protein
MIPVRHVREPSSRKVNEQQVRHVKDFKDFLLPDVFVRSFGAVSASLWCEMLRNIIDQFLFRQY